MQAQIRAAGVLVVLVALAGACTDGDSGGSGGDGDSGGAAAAGPAPTVEVPDGQAGTVTAVIDGDTFDVEVDGRSERVRMLGINTPERDECFAQEASDSLAALLDGEEVVLVRDVTDTDQYGRLLRYAFAEGVFTNAEQARLGNAVSNRYEPDTARQGAIDEAEAEARAAARGQWAPDACGEAVSGSSDVEIVDLQPNPPGPDEADRNGETVAITNGGSDEVDLSGWLLRDTSARHRFTFPPGTVLAPAARLVVHTGCGDDTSAELFWCDDDPVWSNGGDTAFLQDPSGNTVSTWTYSNEVDG